MKPYLHKIQYYETDKMQITHHANYIRFMEEARIDFFEQIGFPYDEVEAQGVFSPVVNVDCTYKKTTTFPETISIMVEVEGCKKFKFTLAYTMRVGEDIVCTGRSTHCFLDRTGRPICYAKDYPALYQRLTEEMNV